jgi:hypothetical protein
MKKIFSVLILSIITSVMFASTTYNIENTNPSTGSLACSYSCTVTVSEHDANNNYQTLHGQTFNIAPTMNHNFTFTPDAGYTIDNSTMTVSAVTNSCTIATFGPSSATHSYNCISCSNIDDVTVWTNSGSLHWKINSDIIVH